MGLLLCPEGREIMPALITSIILLALLLVGFLIPYIGIVWTHAPIPISEIIMGLINELRQAAERKIHEDHHM